MDSLFLLHIQPITFRIPQLCACLLILSWKPAVRTLAAVQLSPSSYQCTYHRIFFGVVLWDGDVVVGDFGSVARRLLSLPHDVVQIWKVMIQVDPFVTVPSLSPVGQF